MKKSTYIELINGDNLNDYTSPPKFKQKIKDAIENNTPFIEVRKVNFYEDRDGFQTSRGASINLMLSAIKSFI